MVSWGDLTGAPEWIYREGELSHVTNWDTKTANDFECEATQLNQTANKLYALNHYLLNPYTRQEISETVNYNPLLQDRITQCTQEAGRIPNFVSLTFTEVSNLFEDIDELNGVSH